MFKRFSERARQVMMLAEEARSLDRHYVGSEHILLALLRETEGVASRSLQRLGVTREDRRVVTEDRRRVRLTVDAPNGEHCEPVCFVGQAKIDSQGNGPASRPAID